MLNQLTDQDAIYLNLETPDTFAHVGGLSLVTLPEGYRGDFYADYRAVIANRMWQIPFLHQRLARLPLDLDPPFWVEAERIDLDHHIRRTTVPAPGGFAELEALVAELHTHPLDRDRPLWQFTVIDGLASGQRAVYIKVHHTAMDGLTSQLLVTTMYDPTPVPRVFPLPEASSEHRGTVRNLVRGVLAHRARQAIRAVQFVPELLTAASHLLLPDARTLHYRPAHRVPVAPHTLFNVGITAERVFAGRTLPLAAVKQLARHTGTTVNDVVLAVSSGALRGYLADKHALPRRSLTAMVPVASRAPGDQASANHNTLMLCSLATDIAEPLDRLAAIHRSAIEQKQNAELWKEFPVPELTFPGMGRLLRRFLRWYGHSWFAGRPPVLGNLVISNVPGPPVPLYIAGARIDSMYPCSVPFHSQAVNITVQSYWDRLDVGLIAARSVVPDVAQLADRVLAAFAELQSAVARSHPEPRAAERPEPATTPAQGDRDRAPPRSSTPAAPVVRA